MYQFYEYTCIKDIDKRRRDYKITLANIDAFFSTYILKPLYNAQNDPIKQQLGAKYQDHVNLLYEYHNFIELMMVYLLREKDKYSEGCVSDPNLLGKLVKKYNDSSDDIFNEKNNYYRIISLFEEGSNVKIKKLSIVDGKAALVSVDISNINDVLVVYDTIATEYFKFIEKTQLHKEFVSSYIKTGSVSNKNNIKTVDIYKASMNYFEITT